MLIAFEVAMMVGVGYMVAWRAQPLARNTIAVIGLMLTGLALVLSASGIVGVDPVVDGRYTAADFIIPIITGITIGLAARFLDGRFPERKFKMPEIHVNLSPDPAAPHVMNASAPRVGMSTSAPPAEGGLL